MYKMSLWQIILTFDIALSQSFTFNAYDTLAFDTSSNGATLGEISGLSHNNNPTTPLFYGISDTILAPYQKTLWQFDYTPTPPTITGITLEDPPSQSLNVSDTENIIYIESGISDTIDKYFIIGTEGYRQWNTNTSFWVYNETGHYVSELSYPDLFREIGQNETDLVSGFNEGDGFESASITSDYSTVVLIGSNTLVQDECADQGCVRILVTTVNTAADPTWTETRQYRYDKDNVRDRGVTVTDATIIENDLSRVIVLEKSEFNDGSFKIIAYQIDISDTTLGDAYDIKSCQILNDACATNMAIPKQKVSDFFEFNGDVANIDNIDFDAIAIGQDVDAIAIGCNVGEMFVLAASDNDETMDTYLLELCLSVQAPTPTPTVSMDMSPPEIGFPIRVLDYDTIAQNFMIENTPFWEISGLSQNNGDDPDPITYYAVSDTILKDFDKMIFSFQLNETGSSISITNINGVVMDEPNNVNDTLKYADTETIIYANTGVAIIGTEGYREFGTKTNFFIFGCDGSFVGNLSYNTDIFQEKGVDENDLISGFGEGDGIESMSVTSDYSTLIFIGSHTLVQDDCEINGCVRISVNTLDLTGEIPSISSEDYQFRYDMDTIPSDYSNTKNTVPDVTIIHNLNKVIVMEKAETILVDNSSYFDVRLYEIDLWDIDYDAYGISMCQNSTMNGVCNNYDMVIPKKLIGDFKTMSDIIPDVTMIDFDAIAYGYGDGCDNGWFLLAASDNNEIEDTYFVSLCLDDDITSGGHDNEPGVSSNEVSVLGYDLIAPTEEIDGTFIWEISGLSHNNHEAISRYYGVSDTILQDFQKQIFAFLIKKGVSEPELDNIAGIPLEHPPYQSLKYADTENIVFLEDVVAGEKYFVIGTEGYRQYGTFTNLFLYDCQGNFVGNLSYNTNVFQEQGIFACPTYGFDEGDGIESMSISEDYNYLIFIGSNTLVQDDCGWNGCVRISINTMDYSTNIPTMTETYQFRYNKDYIGESNRVVDVTIIKNDLSIVIVMEEAFVLKDGIIIPQTPNDYTFSIRLYAINLKAVIDNYIDYDIKNCRRLTDSQCNNYNMEINKTLISNFDKDLGLNSIDFDAIAVGDGPGCPNGYFLVAASDNDETENTTLAYLCYDIGLIPAEDNNNSPINKKISVLGFDTFDSDTTVITNNEETPVWEISGLSHNNNEENGVFYGVSDTILQDFTKQIFIFDIQGEIIPNLLENSITGIILEDPPLQPLKYADTETITYLEYNDNKFFIIGTEGYREYDKFTNFFIYNYQGEFIGNLSYNTNVFQEQGSLACPTYGYDEGDGIESMSSTSDYMKLIFVGSNTLVQDDCYLNGCVRISINNINYNNNMPSITEIYQIRYDKDVFNNPNTINTISDITILENDLSVVLILEKAETINSQGISTFDHRIYEIDLSNIDSTNDIKNCNPLKGINCANYNKIINKILVADFADFQQGQEALPIATSIDFDSLAVGKGIGCDNGYFLLAASDNSEIHNTYFIYLCYDAGFTKKPTKSPTKGPTPTDTVGDDSTENAMKISIKFVTILSIFVTYFIY
eukprot:269721_1